jgi:2-oxoglutarate ferredoxin oxidoreductase subunit gamma
MTVIVTFTGFGGQGIIKTSVILGQAAVRQGKFALQNQAYGPQSRGGISKGDVIISDSHVYEIEPDECDILVALSQQSFDKYAHSLKKGGLLVYDSGLVRLSDEQKREFDRVGAVEATKIATEKFGNRILTGTLMLGYVGSAIKVIDRKNLEKAISEGFPKDTVKNNLLAFDYGWKAESKRTRC